MSLSNCRSRALRAARGLPAASAVTAATASAAADSCSFGWELRPFVIPVESGGQTFSAPGAAEAAVSSFSSSSRDRGAEAGPAPVLSRPDLFHGAPVRLERPVESLDQENSRCWSVERIRPPMACSRFVPEAKRSFRTSRVLHQQVGQDQFRALGARLRTETSSSTRLGNPPAISRPLPLGGGP